MKIVSKYKDFYDYLVQDHDADIVFVRQLGIVKKYYDDLFKVDGNYTPYYSYRYGYYGSRSYNRYNDGDFTINSYLFGIYPYVYSQPVLEFKYTTITDIEEWGSIILSKTLVDRILSGEDCYDDISKLVNDVLVGKHVKPFKIQKYRGDLSHVVKKHTWKVECKELFIKINSPVFVKYSPELFSFGAYYENTPEFQSVKESQKIHYVTGISFQKLNFNILKYWYDDIYDLNTYINIENFLWSVKQEPVANPDNNTKILSHGFDLKTSFRKM